MKSDMERFSDKKNSAGISEKKASITRGSYVAPQMRVDGGPKPGGYLYRCVKRVFDIFFSAVMTAVLILPTALLCIAVVIDSPGSPIFLQERIGRGGKIIHILKIRTMYKDAHTNPGRYFDEKQFNLWRRERKVVNDPRVTRIGRVLRSTSLDELPQFINVLMGDLSVIGPRPVTSEETYEYGNARAEVLACKPGITGWWQVTERNSASWETGRRQELELFYVRHACLGLDMRIFARTFKAMVRKTGR